MGLAPSLTWRDACLKDYAHMEVTAWVEHTSLLHNGECFSIWITIYLDNHFNLPIEWIESRYLKKTKAVDKIEFYNCIKLILSIQIND